MDCNEHRALQKMIDRSSITKALVIADRGYESYNNMAHIQEKGWYFLIRIKDGKTGIKDGLTLPDVDEFDEHISLKLTRKQTKETKELSQDKNHYRLIPGSTTFDYLPQKSRKADPVKFYTLNFRIVRFKVTDELCKEHNLSIISPNGQRGKKYNEWQADKSGGSDKSQLRKDTNIAIKSAFTYEEFLLLMRANQRGNFCRKCKKIYFFSSSAPEKFYTWQYKVFGKGIYKRTYQGTYRTENGTKSYHPQKRAFFTKVAVANYNEVGSLSEREHKISIKKEAGKSAKQSIVELEYRIKDLAEIMKYTEQYKANRSYYIGYKKSKNPNAYFRRYESQIILYGGCQTYA